MRTYRVREGLFFGDEDEKLYRDRVKNTRAGAAFAKGLKREVENIQDEELAPVTCEWYAYPQDVDHALDVDSYQNINGIVGKYLCKIGDRIYKLALCQRILGEDRSRELRRDMLAAAHTFPLHLFVHADMGLILYHFQKDFLFALDAVRSIFTEEEQFTLDTFARGVAMDVMANQEEWLRSRIGKQHCNNHLVAHSQIAIATGLYYGRQDWVEYGLHNPEGIMTYLEDGMSDKGMGIEGSLRYNLLSAVLMMETAEILKRGGVMDLYHAKNSRGWSLKDYFVTALQFVNSDGRLVPIGDNYGKGEQLADMEVFHRACCAYGEEEHALIDMLTNATKEADNLFRLALGDVEGELKEESTSQVWGDYGLAVLKEPQGVEFWKNDSLALAVRTGKGIIHGNCDHMAMMLFHGKDFVLRDFESLDMTSRHGFSGHVTRTLNRSRMAHCGVMIDGMDTKPLQVVLKTEYTQGDGWQKIVVEDDEGLLYAGVRQKRTLTLEAGRLTDVYEVECGEERDIDYVAHLPGNADGAHAVNGELLAAWYPRVWPSDTIKWMLDACEVDAEGGYAGKWPGVDMRVEAEGVKKALLFSLPEADDLSMGYSRSIALRVHGKKAVFRAEYAF